MGMVGEACLPSNVHYPRTPDYTLYSGVHVCWSEHSDSSFVYGFMSLDYDRNYFVLVFFSPFSIATTSLGEEKLILVLFVRLFDLCLFGFVGFLFHLVSGKSCGLWVWHSLDFSLTFYFHFSCKILERNTNCFLTWSGGNNCLTKLTTCKVPSTITR